MPTPVLNSRAHIALRDLLVVARKEARLTQVELAKRLGRRQALVSLIERGHRRIDVIEFCAIARALDTDPATLFKRLLKALPAKLDVF